MSRQVTQRDIAQAAGVTQSAVSLALRDSPRISQQQRDHILAIAKQLGYQNDPLSSGLARRKQSAQLPTIAFLGTHTQGEDHYALALERIAQEQKRSVYWVPVERQSDEGLYDDLQRRSVAGVLIGQATRKKQVWQTAWQNIAQVHCGLYHAPSTGDIIAHDLFAAPRQLYEHVCQRGFAQIAALLPLADTQMASLSERLLMGGLLSLQEELKSMPKQAVHVARVSRTAAVEEWLRCIPKKSDVIFCYDNATLRALRDAGERRPCFVLVLDKPKTGEQGLLINYEQIMRNALQRLDQKMHLGHFGQMDGRQLTLLDMRLQL